MDRPLKLGAAYHGNRMPHHAWQDLHDMSRNGMDIVVHMLSHTDWDRHLNKMKEIVQISTDAGLESWIDNWGLGGPPGDKSHFLSYHPEAHQYYSDGSVDPVRVCLASEEYRAWVREWIDAVGYIGARTIFWDEPHLPMKGTGYACACPRCRERFRARYGYDMPEKLNADAEQFRLDTIREYFEDITSYAHEKGLVNTVCVMLGEQNGISLHTLDAICGVPHLDNIGSDPYWLGIPQDQLPTVYDFVYRSTKENLRVSDHFQKDHNIWIQTYSTPRGREEEIVEAAAAAYDAGARTILCWGYYGSESNDYAAQNPERTWAVTCDAFHRVREMERDHILAARRAALKQE